MRAAWERCIEQEIRGWNERWLSRFSPLIFPAIQSSSNASNAEAKAISGLNHPHICVLHDIGQQDGIDYLVMECVEGETLEKRLEKGPLPLEQVVKYGAQVADGLDKARRRHILAFSATKERSLSLAPLSRNQVL